MTLQLLRNLLTIQQMFNKLTKRLSEYKSVVLGFSGGVDSSLLAYALKSCGVPYVCATVQTPLQSQREIAQSAFFCKQYGITHKIINVDVLANDKVMANPEDRCYYCKKEIFGTLLGYANELGFVTVMDGTNADDLKEYRPGLKAKDELGIVSPLSELGITKMQIRQMAREQGLSVWDMPSSPCLATRIPYGTELDNRVLRAVEAGENVLANAGLQGVRLRAHGEIARIEAKNIKEAFDIIDDDIINDIKACGFKFVCLDLDGYKKGSFDK